MSQQHHTSRPTGRGVLPGSKFSARVRQYVIEVGEVASAAHLGLGRATVARLAANMPCRPGSILMAAKALGIDLDHNGAG